MKRLTLLLAFLASICLSKAQSPEEDSAYIGKYHSEEFVSIFTEGNIQLLVDSLNVKLNDWLIEAGGFNGHLLSYEIDDQAPFNDTAVAYLSIKLFDEEKDFAVSVHLLLEKVTYQGDVFYKIDKNPETVAAKGAVCKSLSGCNGCDKVRNWFLGPVKRCDCNTEGQDANKCELTSGDTDAWGILQVLASVAAAAVTIIKLTQ